MLHYLRKYRKQIFHMIMEIKFRMSKYYSELVLVIDHCQGLYSWIKVSFLEKEIISVLLVLSS
jgi:hypothetical protein